MTVDYKEKKIMISGSQLSKIAPSIKGERANLIAGLLDNICPQYGIDTPDIFHEFIANLLHECGEFKIFEENLHYRPQRLMAIWPKRFPDILTAKQFAANPEKLANYVYGARKDLGNNKPGDGWLFRGSGAIQLTGRSNIATFTKFYNNKFQKNYTPEQMADLLRKDLDIGIHSACWFFAIAKGLIDEAISDQVKTIIKRINGGFIGLDDRLKYYERAKKYIT